MSISYTNMTKTERAAFDAHCARTGETPELKIRRLNAILHGRKVALHHRRAKHHSAVSF